ncbi:SIR2 family NAD-dependent protein deacylase [Sphingobacterium detergens]
MLKEKLFEKIRSEDVIIWAGAGLSMSSGFPSGYGLKEILYNSLTEGEKKMVGTELSLMELSQAIVDIQGTRNHLVSQLYKIFKGKVGTIGSVHQKLAKIPHFKNIFTTNYDRLLEQAIDNSIAISNEHQIALLESNRGTRIFKMHGDLSDPNSLVITTSDYNAMFRDDKLNNALWGFAKALISTKTVLFLGYGVEDSNFQVLLDGITRALGGNRKEFFFVAPGISDLKQIQLKARNINYIDSTAETLIDELYENILANITSDLHEKKVSADTFGRFMDSHNCIPVLQTNGNSFEIVDIKTNGPIELAANIDFIDQKKVEEFEKHLVEFPSKPFVFNASEIKKLVFSYSGILLDIMRNAEQIEFSRIPTTQGFVEIRFEDGQEFFLYGAIYSRKGSMDVIVKLVSGELTIKLTQKNDGYLVNFHIEHFANCKDVRSEIEFFSFVTTALQKKAFTITTESGKVHTFQGSDFKKVTEFDRMLQYFQDLKLIENFFDIRFQNFTISEARKSAHERDVLLSMINDEFLAYPLKENVDITTDKPLSKKVVEHFKIPEEKQYFKCVIVDNEKLTLLGKEFNIGKKEMEIPDATCMNLDEVHSGSNRLILKSEKGVGRIRYRKNE